MKLVLNEQTKVNQLITIFKNLKVFTTNLVINMNEEKGIFIQGIDNTQCCLCEVKIVPSWFSVFEFDANNDMPVIGINTIILQKVMNTYTDGQSIELITNGEADKLTILFLGKEDVFNKHFEIPLMNIEVDILAIPEEEKQVDLTIETKIFVELINQLQIFDDTLKVTFSEDSMEFIASGIEGEMKVNVSLDDVIEYGVEEELILTQNYSLRFIQLMCAFNKLSTEMCITFNDDKPMEGKYILGENSYMSFFISPKIED